MSRPPLPALAAVLLAAAGCGYGPESDPRTKLGSFSMMEGAAEDLCATVLDERYRPSTDLGTDSDRIGMALFVFLKEAADTPLAADAEAVKQKVNALEQLAAGRAPLDRQREAALALREAIAALKAKL